MTVSRFLRCRSGATAVEFSFVGLLFIMLTIGVIETGRALHVRNHMGHAADVAARRLLIDASTPDGTLDGVIRSAFTQGDPDLLEIGFQNEVVDDVECRRMAIEYPLTLGFAGMPAIGITLTVQRRIPLT